MSFFFSLNIDTIDESTQGTQISQQRIILMPLWIQCGYDCPTKTCIQPAYFEYYSKIWSQIIPVIGSCEYEWRSMLHQVEVWNLLRAVLTGNKLAAAKRHDFRTNKRKMIFVLRSVLPSVFYFSSLLTWNNRTTICNS